MPSISMSSDPENRSDLQPQDGFPGRPRRSSITVCRSRLFVPATLTPMRKTRLLTKMTAESKLAARNMPTPSLRHAFFSAAPVASVPGNRAWLVGAFKRDPMSARAMITRPRWSQGARFDRRAGMAGLPTVATRVAPPLSSIAWVVDPVIDVAGRLAEDRVAIGRRDQVVAARRTTPDKIVSRRRRANNAIVRKNRVMEVNSIVAGGAIQPAAHG